MAWCVGPASWKTGSASHPRPVPTPR
jgi:hypothetical protein